MSAMIGRHAVLCGLERGVEPHRHVAAADVEAHAGHAELPLVGDHAADRLRVAEVAVRAHHPGDRVAHAHAVLHLRDGAVLVLAQDDQRAVAVAVRLGAQRRDLRRGDGLPLGGQRRARRVPPSESTAAASGGLGGVRHAGVRIVPGFGREQAGLPFQRVGAAAVRGFGHWHLGSAVAVATQLFSASPPASTQS
jgi:hypothetical protein